MDGKLKTNAKGLPVGEDHHNARYLNHDVDLVLSLRDEGLSYGQISRRMEIPKSTVRDWVKGVTRGQW